MPIPLYLHLESRRSRRRREPFSLEDVVRETGHPAEDVRRLLHEMVSTGYLLHHGMSLVLYTFDRDARRRVERTFPRDLPVRTAKDGRVVKRRAE